MSEIDADIKEGLYYLIKAHLLSVVAYFLSDPGGHSRMGPCTEIEIPFQSPALFAAIPRGIEDLFYDAFKH